MILELEYNILKKIIMKRHSILDFSLGIVYLSQTALGHPVHFIRALEWGKFLGLCDSWASSNPKFNIFIERVMTVDDLALLSSTESRSTAMRLKDVSDIECAWFDACGLLDQEVPGFVSWFATNNKGQVRIRSFNCNANEIKDIGTKLQAQPDMRHWSLALLVNQSPSPLCLNLEAQLNTINCLPSILPTKYCKKFRDPLFVKWNEQSVRHAAMFSMDNFQQRLKHYLSELFGSKNKQRQRKRFRRNDFQQNGQLEQMNVGEAVEQSLH